MGREERSEIPWIDAFVHQKCNERSAPKNFACSRFLRVGKRVLRKLFKRASRRTRSASRASSRTKWGE